LSRRSPRYTKAVELKSDYDEAYYYRGNAYSLKGNYDQAIADYKKTLDISPNFQDAESRLEDALKKKK
jgi:tetratricopeptide (TPR) repeat protein